jgi:hypothetical protein
MRNFFIFNLLIIQRKQRKTFVFRNFYASLPRFFIGYWILHEAGFLSGLFYVLLLSVTQMQKKKKKFLQKGFFIRRKASFLYLPPSIN